MENYAKALTSELESCKPAAEKQVLLLLSEPLLLYMVEHEEFVTGAGGLGATSTTTTTRRKGSSCSCSCSCSSPSCAGAKGGGGGGGDCCCCSSSAGANATAAGCSRVLQALLPELLSPLHASHTELLLERGGSHTQLSSLDGGAEPQSLVRTSSLAQRRRRGSRLSLAGRSCDGFDPVKQTLLRWVPITSRAVGLTRNHLTYHQYCSEFDAPVEQLLWSRYEVQKALGEGHFGVVYMAKERCSGQFVAVKVFERTEDDSDEDTICDEGHILNALGHPNLIRVLEVVETRDAVHVVMEMASGVTLNKYALSTPRGNWISGAMQQVLSAAAYCHNLNLLHGDMKPENVLTSGLRPDGSPLCLVCDFGHASVATRDTCASGDPRYVAPEVFEQRGFSPKSDIFMLGMSMYELLTGGWLPFFQEPAARLDSQCPFYDATLAWFMITNGPILERMQKGLDFNDLDRLKTTKLAHEDKAWGVPAEAKQLLTQMLSWNEKDRPSAEEALAAPYLAAGHLSCVAARDTSRPASFGLWRPPLSSDEEGVRSAALAAFEEGLTRRKDRSVHFRLFLAGVATGLDPQRLLSARLLFRWMDSRCAGLLGIADFVRAGTKFGLPKSLVEQCFYAADLYKEGWVDFKNFVAFFLDPQELDRDELLSVCKAVLNRLHGAVAAANDPGFDGSSAPRVGRETLQVMFGCSPNTPSRGPTQSSDDLTESSERSSNSNAAGAVAAANQNHPSQDPRCAEVSEAIGRFATFVGKEGLSAEGCVQLLLGTDIP